MYIEACSSAADNSTACNDIAQLLKINNGKLNNLSQSEMYRILTTECDSNPSSYPRSRPCKTGLARQFQPTWLSKFRWLHYSRSVDGAYCRACVLFGPTQVYGQRLGHFVTTPFTSWTKMSEKATSHSTIRNDEDG